MAHKHAELMKQYAEDAANYDRPWELWEFRQRNSCLDCKSHPEWRDDMEYVRKPQVMIINGHAVPLPLKVVPELRTKYYFICFSSSEDLYDYYEWTGDGIDYNLFKLGICHLTKEAAIAHAEALLSFTEK